MRVSIFVIFLIQVIVYSLLWLIDEYVASYLCIVIPVIAFAILVVSLLSELFERSRISRKYFIIMGVTILTPLMVGMAFYTLYDGKLEWMQGI